MRFKMDHNLTNFIRCHSKIATMKKTLISIVTVIAMVLSVLYMPIINGTLFDAEAAENDSISSAQSYSLGSYETGSITKDGDTNRYYSFSLPEAGEINITGQVKTYCVYFHIFDSTGKAVWNASEYQNDTTEIASVDDKIVLTSGKYVFCIERFSAIEYYNFKINFTSYNASFNESEGGSNNSLQTADTVYTNGTKYTEQVANNDEKDFWKFNLNESGKVDFDATFYDFYNVYWNVYDENGKEILSNFPYNNSTTNDIVVDSNFYLTAGTYYLSVIHSIGYGKYDFSLNFTSANETFPENNGGSNNTIQSASNLTLGNTIKGSIDINDTVDFYRFSTSADGKYMIIFNSDASKLNLKLFDTSGNEFWSKLLYCDDTTHNISFSENVKLDPSTYYLAVEKDGCGDYSLSVSKLTKANCPHKEYDSERHDATYFSKGYTKYTCKECGYTYKSNYTNKRVLGKVSNPIYRYPVKKGVNLSWYYVSDANGYQVRYSTKKSMSTNVKKRNVSGTSVNLRKLSRKKTYYIQIRAYVKDGSKVAYGSWSPKIKCKTK